MTAPSTAPAIYYDAAQRAAAEASRDAYQAALKARARRDHDRDRRRARLYYAEDYHQQYLGKNPTATAAWAAPA